jgi:hypothetical protein
MAVAASLVVREPLKVLGASTIFIAVVLGPVNTRNLAAAIFLC